MRVARAGALRRGPPRHRARREPLRHRQPLRARRADARSRLASSVAQARNGRRAGVSANADVALAPSVDASVRRRRDLALEPRPERARRQCRTRARSFANGGVACLMHTAVATSLTPSETVASTHATRRPRSALGVRSRLPCATRPENLRGEPCGARAHGRSRCGAHPGKGILGRIRPSLPRRPYEDGRLLQLERCHDVEQHSGGLAAAGGGGRAPRRRVGRSCGSACRRSPGVRSGAAC